MPVNLDTVAMEGGTFAVTAAFTDEDGDAMTPDTVTWTLTDRDGTVINSRQDVSATPATSVTVVLSGADLLPITGETGNLIERRILFEGTYTSDLGSGLPFKKAGAFLFENLAGV